MKKSTFLAGVISTILLLAGVTMKSLHWPGAAVVLTVAIATFSLGYAVMLFLDKNKMAQNGYERFTNVMVMATMIIVAVSFLFKAMHWPVAGIGIYVAHIFLLSLLPILYIQGTRETDPVKKLHIDSSAILVAFIAAISLYIWWRTSS
ncbi:MAG: hypothetical protein NT092_05440 [Bacteroidia bacterium]|nr:hypothetical protein [Bacteroidia bacterium]